jgi:hypothetical protein
LGGKGRRRPKDSLWKKKKNQKRKRLHKENRRKEKQRKEGEKQRKPRREKPDFFLASPLARGDVCYASRERLNMGAGTQEPPPSLLFKRTGEMKPSGRERRRAGRFSGVAGAAIAIFVLLVQLSGSEAATSFEVDIVTRTVAEFDSTADFGNFFVRQVFHKKKKPTHAEWCFSACVFADSISVSACSYLCS